MSRRYREYQQYLESAHWRNLRQQAFKRDGFKCTQCPATLNLRGHHVRYRKDLRLCTVDDISTLCKKCHDRHHKKMKRLRKLNRKRRSNRGLIDLIMNYSADSSSSIGSMVTKLNVKMNSIAYRIYKWWHRRREIKAVAESSRRISKMSREERKILSERALAIMYPNGYWTCENHGDLVCRVANGDSCQMCAAILTPP